MAGVVCESAVELVPLIFVRVPRPPDQRVESLHLVRLKHVFGELRSLVGGPASEFETVLGDEVGGYRCAASTVAVFNDLQVTVLPLLIEDVPSPPGELF